MYIDVALRPSLAPQLNILVNDIPIVQVACVLCRASASIAGRYYKLYLINLSLSLYSITPNSFLLFYSLAFLLSISTYIFLVPLVY